MKFQKDSGKIVRAAIHPSIGIARVGESKTDYFLGPEVSNPKSHPPGFYRDDAGAIKRQGARFRIYGYNARGEVIAELTAGEADITWEIHLANKKGAWYLFNYPMDIPQAAAVARRNLNFQGAAREKLVIDPGARRISGVNEGGKGKYAFRNGEFMGRKVFLGELRTDEQGRLIVLGGHGVAESVYPGNFITGVGNQDGWYDDIADGPVSATVRLPGGKSIPVTPAWIVAAPPSFVPDLQAIVTLWDCIFDALVSGSVMAFPNRLSFCQDIYPIFRRLSAYQWLNEGFNAAFGHGGAYPFHDEAFAARLSRNDQPFRELRREIFRRFRDPASREPAWDKWPWNYGDAINVPPHISYNQYSTVTATQYRILGEWVAGNFEDDWDQRSAFLQPHLSDYPMADQPAVLDRASLDFAVGGPFRPGVELTWPMRLPTLYAEPFRIRVRTAANPEPDYGPALTPQATLAMGGPLYYSGPGDLTRWMSVPWQIDLAACRYAYFGEDPYLPTFWPVRAPNQVLTDENYQKVMDPDLPRSERISAYYDRRGWYRFLQGGTFEQMNQMLAEFVHQGFIQVRPGLPDDPDFPPVMLVEEPLSEAIGRRPEADKDSFIDYQKILAFYQQQQTE